MYWRVVPPKSIVALVSPAARAEVAGHAKSLVWPPSLVVAPDAASPVVAPPLLPLLPLLPAPGEPPPLPDAPMPELPAASSPPPPEDPGPLSPPPEALMSPVAVADPESDAGVNCVAQPTPLDSQIATTLPVVSIVMAPTIVLRDAQARLFRPHFTNTRLEGYTQSAKMCSLVAMSGATPYGLRGRALQPRREEPSFGCRLLTGAGARPHPHHTPVRGGRLTSPPVERPHEARRCPVLEARGDVLDREPRRTQQVNRPVAPLMV